MANNTLLASDTFASGSLASGWATAPNSAAKCQVIAGSPNVTEPTVINVHCGQIWTALSWTNDHISEVITNLVSGTTGYVSLMVRSQSGVNSGYQCDINNGSAILYRVDSGVATQIATGSATAFASGDVWALSAVGSQIAVYQSGKRICWAADATYTTGSPGYAQFSSSVITETKVFSWRGYSFQQQCGVWNKKQITIAGIAGETNGISNSHVFIDSNPQILAGSNYCCFLGGNGIKYAESYDGINWTRYSGNPVIAAASAVQARMFKVGSTYNLFAVNAAGTAIDRYTSTNKTSWTLANSSVLAVGSVGAWDSVQLWNFTVVANISGTYHALYGGWKGGTNNWGMGHATSPDLITWTKDAGNPVFTGVIPSGAVPINIGGTWYVWGTGYPPGAEIGANFVDPGESVRLQSTDLVNWTNLVHSFGTSQFAEGVNANGVGTSYMSSILQVGNQTYGYFDVGPIDSASGYWQIGLATVNGTPTQLVQGLENATVQIASDNFGGTLSNWTTVSGTSTLQIVGGKLEASALSTECAMAYTTGVAVSTQHYSEITIAVMSANTAHLQAAVCMQTGTNSCYQMALVGPTGTQNSSAQIVKKVAGVGSFALAPAVPSTPQIGDVYRLEVTTSPGGWPVLSIYQNGYLLSQMDDMGQVGGAALGAGYPGVVFFVQTSLANGQVSLWAGGSSAVIPANLQGGSSAFDILFRGKLYVTRVITGL